MKKYQQRVVEEKKELDEKLEKLKAFTSSETFNQTVGDEAECNRLLSQQAHMTHYSEVLGERIENFSKDET